MLLVHPKQLEVKALCYLPATGCLLAGGKDTVRPMDEVCGGI